jgi:RNA polymerase sigma factor (sigma-70 family)
VGPPRRSRGTVVASAAVDGDGGTPFDAVLARARAGDQSAWAALYDALAPQLLGYLRVRGARDADGVLGDVFLHVARGIRGFDGDGLKFRSWVFVVATSRLLDERRRLRRRPTESLESATEERVREPVDVQAEVEQAAAAAEVDLLLCGLTPDQRQVVELRVFGELTSQEVADIVGKPVGAVKALYRRGLGALRRALEPAGDAEKDQSLLPFPGRGVPLRLPAAVTKRP